MEQEEWRPVAGLEGKYSVSNLGRVMSHGRVCGNGIKPERILKAFKQGRGNPWYVSMEGMDNHRIDKMVLEAFIGSGEYPCHLDGDSENNKLDNLKWGTRKEALAYMRKSGAQSNSKLGLDDVLKIRKMHNEGYSIREISAGYSVSKATVSNVVKRKTWAMV